MDVSAPGSSTASADACVVGVDFGTLSGRAVVVRVADGAELGSAVHDYRDGAIEGELPGTGLRLPPDWALQNPEDWRDVLRQAVPEAVRRSGVDLLDIVGVATDFTACTVLPSTVDGTPLCQLPELAGRPHAWPKLWKHHAAQPQADRINALAHRRNEPWIGRYGGKVSSEWEFAKALQVLEEDPEVYARAERWIEAADWIVWQLAGVESRNLCTAGYKGIFQDGRYPSAEFLGALDPRFADFPPTRLAPPDGRPLAALGSRVGSLTEQAAGWTGLPAGIAVAAGNVDAHVTAPAADAVADGRLLAIMGTSTCHVVNASVLADVPGICGVVDGGITAGAYGYEAGQSAVGDIFAWWLRTGVPASYQADADARGESLHDLLSRLCADQPVGAHGLVALDWMGGNRSVLADHDLSGIIAGLTLATRPEEVYRALLEATAFGTRVIAENFERHEIPIHEFIVAGGLKQNALLLQIYADVLRRPVSVAVSGQGPALGSAIHAAVAAGEYPDVPTAAKAMGRVERGAYRPDPARAEAYDALYAEYTLLHDTFAGAGMLHRLRRIRNTALARAAGPDPDSAERGRPVERRGAVPATGNGTAVERIQRELCALHAELVRWGLVVWTAGNVSARVPDRDLLVIKPSGVPYDELTPAHMIVCDLHGKVVEGDLAPSSDTAAHAYVYRRRADVGGVAHTHSPYATAWAARGEPIPCVLTAMADEFGGEVPVGPFALIGGDDIGRGIVATLDGHRSPAVLMRSHGVFTIGRSAQAAVKAAVMTEDVARTVHLVRQHGEPAPIPPADIDALYHRYQNLYGQRLSPMDGATKE